MILRTLEHGRAVMRRLKFLMPPKRRWLVFDTETKEKPGFDKKDTLVIGRTNILVFSFCYCGESYSAPTGIFNPDYPLAFEWLEAFRPVLEDKTIVKVFHNANYDLNAFWTEGYFDVFNYWDTMIGAWKANASLEKGLKSRAPLYGRHLRKTSSVDFSSEDEITLYAEEDVITTDELYQMQRYGYIERPKFIHYLDEDNHVVTRRNPLPHGRLKITSEDLDEQETAEVRYQELPYLKATIRAERLGFPFNTDRLHDIRKNLAQDKDEALRKIFRLAGRTLNLNSSKQLAVLFASLGIHSPERTKKGAESFNAKALFKMQDEHPLVNLISNYKALEKLQSVYVGDPSARASLGLEHYVQKDGRIRASASTVGAVTGRGSSSNPNLTQIPSAKDTYGIKQCFIPPKGMKLICLDYAQLELRVATLFHRDKAMRKILCDPKGDLHTYTAEQFGVDRDPTAKQINFLLQYGGGEYVLSEKLTTEGSPTTKEQARTLILRYNQVYCAVLPWRKALLDEHQVNGFVRLFTGRKRWLLDVDWENKSHLHKAETTLANNVVQGSGQDFLKAAIIRADPLCINPDKVILGKFTFPKEHTALLKDLGRKLEKYRKQIKLARCKWLLQIHDEALWYCEKEAALDIANILAEIMTWPHYFPPIKGYCVPLVADGGVGDSWKEAKSKDNPDRVHVGF